MATLNFLTVKSVFIQNLPRINMAQYSLHITVLYPQTAAANIKMPPGIHVRRGQNTLVTD